MPFKTPKILPLPITALALTAAFAAAFVMTGCSKNKDDDTRENAHEESSTWIPPPLPELINYDPHPLFFQVSVDPVVYIWQQLPRPQSDAPKDEDDYGDMTFAMMPSRLADALPRMMAYKAGAEADGRIPTIWLTGDERATCGSILQLIDEAKRAGIERILFETAWRETGIGNYSYGEPWCDVAYWPRYYDFKSDAKYARKIITITILADYTITWEKKPVSLGELVEKLSDYRNKVGPENAVMVVEVDAKANFTTMRHVIDQIRRAAISKVMVCPLKAE